MTKKKKKKDDVDEVEEEEEEDVPVDPLEERYRIDYDNVEDRILDEVDHESFQEEDDDDDDEEKVDDLLFDDDSAYDNGIDVDFVDDGYGTHHNNNNYGDSDDEVAVYLDDTGYGDDDDDVSQHYDDEDKDHESNRYFRDPDCYVKDKVQITKQSLLGGPITSILILSIHTTTYQQQQQQQHEQEYDVLYGQGPYLHHVPHKLWIRQQHQLASSETKPDGIIHQPSRPKQSDTPPTDNNNNDDDVPLLVFPNGGTIHGIRDFGYYEPINQHVILIFGGRQLAFLGMHRQHKQKQQQQQHHHTTTSKIVINLSYDHE